MMNEYWHLMCRKLYTLRQEWKYARSIFVGKSFFYWIYMKYIDNHTSK